MKLPELRGILQYVTRFRDKIFVIAIDGQILGSENFANILLDIAVLRSLNIKVVLVHGAEHDSARKYYFLQRLFPAEGVGVFVYDKRGTGGSPGVVVGIPRHAGRSQTSRLIRWAGRGPRRLGGVRDRD